MARTVEQIEEQLRIERDLGESFNRLQGGGLSWQERELETERRSALVARLEELKAAAKPPPPPPVSNAKTLSPAEAAKRAAEIRDDPKYFKQPCGLAERQAHERLIQEHGEMMRRSEEVE